MIDELFKFPIVMIDGDNEERKNKDKQRFGEMPNTDEEEEGEYDMVFGEAEYPYWDFIGIEDRWLPSKESLQKALEGRFEACIVRFANVGQLLVPWTKKKFKSEIQKFGDEYEIAHPPKETQKVGPQPIRILNLTAEEYKKMIDGSKDPQ